MPVVGSHSPGDFCWVELATFDQNSAKDFYGALFGWTPRDVPIGPNDVYSLMQLQGRIAAGLYTMRREESAAGIPPHWKLYVRVKSADESAARAAGLGAKVIDWPFDIGDRGRTAVIQDPTGAIFYVWEPKQRAGLDVIGDSGAFLKADLVTPDTDRSRTFYEDLFGWRSSPVIRPSTGEPPHWLAYFAVDDIRSALDRANQMNARVLHPPASSENGGLSATLADPQGAVFALRQTS